jgi:hypothetical protein
MRRALLALLLILALAAPSHADDAGVVWQVGPAITAQNAYYAGVVLSDKINVLLRKSATDVTGKTIDIFVSTDSSNTYTLTVSSANTGLANALPTALSAIYISATAQYLVGGAAAGSGLSPLVRGGTFSWAFPTLSGAPAGTMTVPSIAQQGGTILALVNGATPAICRSTDNASTFSCASPSGLGALAALTTSSSTGTLQGVASPRLKTWLVLDNSNQVFRSIDDGVTWTNVTRLTTNTTVNALACVTSTTCLALASSNAQTQLQLFQSTDAGATWTSTFNIARGDRITNLLNLGSGTVVALGDPTVATGTPFAYRSVDFGATWTAVYSPVITAPQVGGLFVGYTGLYPQSTATAANAAAVFCTAGVSCAVQLLRDPPSASTNVASTVAQGAPTTQGSRWPVFLTDGTNAQGTASNPLVVANVQNGTILNQSATSGAATANVITLTGTANTRIHLYGFSASCSAGSATVAFTDGGTTVFSLPGAPVPATTSVFSYAPSVPYTSTGTNQNLVITIGSCGGGNTSTLNVLADQW